MKAIVLFEVVFAVAASAADYSARQTTRDGVDVVVLADSARHTEVTILPSIGNMAYRDEGERQGCVAHAYRNPGRVQGQTGHDGNPASVALGQPHRPKFVLRKRQAICVQPGTGQCPPGCQQEADPRPFEHLLRVEGGVMQGGRPGGRSDQPSGILEVSRPDGAVPLRSYHRDDLPAQGGRASGGDGAAQSCGRADARGDRFPLVLQGERCAARPMEDPPGGARPTGSLQGSDSHRRANLRAIQVSRPASAQGRPVRRRVHQYDPGCQTAWASSGFRGRRRRFP